jgi:Thiol:disulfide interchange protein DsbD, N-terminal
MTKLRMKRTLLAGLTLVVAAAVAHTQIFATSAQNRSIPKGDAVQYLFPEQVTVAAGKASPVTLHFRIAPGLHINSHTPSDDYLIPTTFSIPEGAGVRLDKASYPAGADMTLPADPKTKLSVYTGEFAIQARIVSTAGNHLVQAKLHYQACDQRQCMPPKTIPVAIDVIGK